MTLLLRSDAGAHRGWRDTAFYSLIILATKEELEYCLGDLEEARAANRAALGEAIAELKYRRDLASCLLLIARRRALDLARLFSFISPERILAALLAASLSLLVIGATLKDADDTSWWRRSGYSHNPGVFMGAHPADYPVCASWGAGDLPPAPKAGAHMSLMRGDLNGKALTTLLPRGARISTLYCAVARGNKPLWECSRYTCEGLAFWVDDLVYSRGHMLTLTLRDHDAVTKIAEGEPLWGQIWVEWRDAGDSNAASSPS